MFIQEFWQSSSRRDLEHFFTLLQLSIQFFRVSDKREKMKYGLPASLRVSLRKQSEHLTLTHHLKWPTLITILTCTWSPTLLISDALISTTDHKNDYKPN